MKNTHYLTEWAETLENDKVFYMAVIDATDRLTFVNAPFFKAFQRAKAAFDRRAFLDLIHHQDLERMNSSLDECRFSGRPTVLEARVKNGQYAWIKWEISPLMESGLQEGKLLCLGYNIPGEEQQQKYARLAGRNFQAILEGLNIGFLFQDIDGIVIAANQRAAEILDTTLEMLYSGRKELPNVELRSNVVVEWSCNDGSSSNILWNTQPIYDDEQSIPYAFVSTLHDITKEKNLEKEVQAREALFSSFMDHTPYVSWIVNPDGDLMYANRSLLKYFHGWKEVIGKNMSNFIPRPLFDALQEKHHVALAEDRADHGIIRSMMADGREHVFRVSVFPISGASQPLSGGEALDITESFTARQEIEKANERLLYISKATSEAIWDWNIKTGHIFCNQALKCLMDTDLDQTFDLEWCYHRIHEEDRTTVEQTIMTVLKEKGKAWEAEYRWQKADGGYMTVYNRGFKWTLSVGQDKWLF